MATDINITIEQSIYEKTRRRVSKFKNQFNISDKEIIESLAEEIEQYRKKIENKDRIIKGLEELNRKRNIETERYIYHCGVDGGTGKDFTVIRWYEDGVLTIEEIKPCQHIDEGDKSTCPSIDIGFHPNC